MSKRKLDNAVTRLIEDLGAEIMVTKKPQPSLTRSRILRRQLAVDESLEEDMIGPCWGSIMGTSGRRVAVIGPSPTPEDAKQGELGWSRSERRLMAELRTRGVKSEHVVEMAAVFRPLDRPPTMAELSEARPLLLAALNAADVDYVLLHGVHAMHQWRKDLTLEQVAGGVYLWGSRWWVTPIMHWSAVNYDVMALQQPWLRHISQFVENINDPNPVLSSRLGRQCAQKKCRESMYAWDQDGVPWCRVHVGDGVHGHQEAHPQPPSKQERLGL